MATKDRRKLQHIHSSIADKQPTPQSLEVGEIAVNNSADKEFLSLKNSNDKVVRFSSDSTLIDWIENKEVVPYKGYVRGETGPSATSGETPSADAYGSYGITNNDLLTNKSNLIFKINQVAAKKTVKYDKINAAKDLYNKDINPSENTPTGKTDGAGFFIDMSRYAMIGANPSFSSITVTDKSDLSGNTTIANGDGTGTRTGHTLAIKTTDVTANDTNWTETITNRTSTVTNETDKITTLNESATTRTTVVGTENLTVSGTTTEVHTGNVTITNSASVTATTNGTTTETKVGNVIENHSGTTTETKAGKVTETNLADKQESTSGNSYNDVKLAYSGTTGGTTTEVKVGVVTENNLSAKTENTTGVLTENNSSDHIVNTTGTTNITRTGVVTEDNKNNVTRTTSGTTTETFKGQVTENNQSGYTVNTTGNVIVNTTGTTTETKTGNVTENHSGTTTENKRGVVTENNLSDKTENTTGAHSIYSTGNTCINSQANANFYGKVNTNIGVACDGTTKGSATTVVGTTTLNMSGATTTISGNTTNVTGATTLNLSGNTTNKRALTANTTSTSAYTSATTATTVIGTSNTSATTATLSGNTLDITEATRLSAKTPSTYVSGSTLDIKESNTTISSCTKLDITSDDLNFNSCTTAGTVDFNFCNGFGVNSNDIKLHQCASAGSISISAQTQNINGGNLTVNESGNTKIYSTGNTNIESTGNTYAVSRGNTQIVAVGDLLETAGGVVNLISQENSVIIASNGVNHSVDISANGNGGDVSVSAKEALCMTAGTVAALVGSAKTNIGMNCNDGGDTTTLNVRGVTTNISAGTLTETVTGTTNETHTGAVTINNGAAKTETTTGAVTENNKAGYTVNTTGDTCLQSTADVNVGGAANTNIGTNCDDSVKANYVNIKAKSGITETANTVTISGTNTVNVSGATVNESGTTHNENFTNYDVNASNDYCVSAATRANFYGKATNIGIDCNGTTIATATTVEGTTVGISGGTTNVSGGTINVKSTGATNISGGNKVNIVGTGGVVIKGYTAESNIVLDSTDCVLIYDSTRPGEHDACLNVDGTIEIPIPCDGITSTTVNGALCEILDRGEVSMDVTSNPAPGILKRYTIKQNGANISGTANGVIDVPKDFLLKSAAVVYGNASADRTSFTACTGTQTNCHWYIELVFNVKDGTSEESKLYLEEDDFIKDITDNNPSGVVADSTYNNVAVKVDYDGKKNWVSATTTPTIHAKENIYADGNISGTNITASTAIRANNVSASTISAATFTGAMSKKLTWAAGAFTADTTGYNGSADKIITVPTAISHIATRGKLTITHNGLSDTYDPASDKSMTLPHSALSFSYGSVSAKTGSDSYNTSAAKSITIPTSIDDLKNYNGTCVEIPHNVCVTGTITSSGAIYSSDRNLKENIMNVSREEINKASNVLAKSFNFKSDESKRKVYGVIAQDVQEVGLDELVHTDDNGNLGVDYTSLLLLKIAYLEDLCGQMYGRIIKLEDKLNDK